MQNIYDKLLNVKFEKFQNLSLNNKDDKEYLRSLDIEQINAMKRELIQGRKTNDTINNQLDNLNEYSQIANDKFEHNYEKLENRKNTSTPWKKAGLIGTVSCIGIGAVLLLAKGIPFIAGIFGGMGVFVSLLALAGLAFYSMYKYASSYKEEAEKKQLMGLMQHGEALRKHTISAQAGLITSTYTNAKDIPLIQKQVCLVQSPVGLEANERFFKGKDEEDDNEEKGEDNSRDRSVIINCSGTQQGR